MPESCYILLYFSYTRMTSPPKIIPGSLEDKFRGLIYGAAIASAVALPCEGRDFAVLRDNHEHDPDYIKYPRDPKKGQIKNYPLNDWSGDVDQLFLVMQSFKVAPQSNKYLLEFATRLTRWKARGLTDLGDSKPEGVDSVTYLVTENQGYTTDPIGVAKTLVGGNQLGSTPMIRCAPLAVLPPQMLYAILPMSVAVTHSDQRVMAATFLQALTIGPMLVGDDPSPNAMREAVQKSLRVFTDAAHRKAFLQSLSNSNDLEKTQIAYQDESGKVSKTVRMVMWAYRQLLRTPKGKRDASLYKDSIEKVILCGRHAAEHASIVGAIFGAEMGFSKLPKEWIAGLPNKPWVDTVIAKYLDVVRSIQQQGHRTV
jgi:ADP-ribosylglycohydrolase